MNPEEQHPLGLWFLQKFLLSSSGSVFLLALPVLTTNSGSHSMLIVRPLPGVEDRQQATGIR